MGCFISMCSSSFLAASFSYQWGQESAPTDPPSSAGAPPVRAVQPRAEKGLMRALGLLWEGAAVCGEEESPSGVQESPGGCHCHQERSESGTAGRSHLLAQAFTGSCL